DRQGRVWVPLLCAKISWALVSGLETQLILDHPRASPRNLMRFHRFSAVGFSVTKRSCC
ncbi:hypothetical protein NPIL_390721, partial [Nephila pilipes]